MSSDTAILWPIMAHVLLVFLLYALLSRRRAAAVREGSATVSQFRQNRDEPDESLFVRNSLASQFELPVLFHVVCLLLFVTGADSLAAVALAWIFVASRYVHAFVHVTSNRVRYRGRAFLLGFLTLAALWAWQAIWLTL